MNLSLNAWLVRIPYQAHTIATFWDSELGGERYSSEHVDQIASAMLHQLPRALFPADGLTLDHLRPCLECSCSNNMDRLLECVGRAALLVNAINSQEEQTRRRRKSRKLKH